MKDAGAVRDFLSQIRIQDVELRAHGQPQFWFDDIVPILLLKSIQPDGRKANVVVFLFYITDGGDKVPQNFYVYTPRSHTQGTATTESKKMTSFSSWNMCPHIGQAICIH